MEERLRDDMEEGVGEGRRLLLDVLMTEIGVAPKNPLPSRTHLYLEVLIPKCH